MSAKLNDPLFIEYWKCQDYLNKLYQAYCENCIHEPDCWTHEGACYREKVILPHCPQKAIRKVIARLREILNKKDIAYLGATGEELLELKKKLKNE